MKTCLTTLALLLAAGTAWAADKDTTRIGARLKSTEEVPAVSSPASGRFRGVVDVDAQTLVYELSFDDLQANVLMAHIHFAQPNVNGGIMVWLCGTATNPGPAGTPVCPQSGTVTGTITPANVQTITTQGIAPNEFHEMVAIIRAGFAYANVHTVQSPGGEIRGQLRVIR